MEVCQNDQYGTICDDGWDNDDATVVCRQLGFNNGEGMQAQNLRMWIPLHHLAFSLQVLLLYQDHFLVKEVVSYTGLMCSVLEMSQVYPPAPIANHFFAFTLKMLVFYANVSLIYIYI